MEDNNSEGSAQSTLSRKPSLKKLTKLGKAIRKRLPKTPKTDRGPASSNESEAGSLRVRKSGSLTSRLKKRFSSTPRRSLSSTDIENLAQTECTAEDDLDDETPVLLLTQSAKPDFLKPAARDIPMSSEFDMYPDTPVGAQRRIQQISINSEKSASFPNLHSGTEEFSEAESKAGETRRSRRPSCPPWTDEASKGSSEQERTVPVVDSESQDDVQEGVELLKFTPFNTPKEEEVETEDLLDAASYIDVSIEETVCKSLYYSNFGTDHSVPKPEEEITEPSPEEDTTNETPKLEQEIKEESLNLEQKIKQESLELEQDIKEESFNLEREIKEESLKHEQKVREDSLKLEQESRDESLLHERKITKESLTHEQEITEECLDSVTEAARVTTRELDLSLMPRPSEVTPAEDQEEENSAPSKKVVKPRKNRFRRFLLREAPISLATMAVGLLFLVFKSRAKGRSNAQTC